MNTEPQGNDPVFGFYDYNTTTYSTDDAKKADAITALIDGLLSTMEHISTDTSGTTATVTSANYTSLKFINSNLTKILNGSLNSSSDFSLKHEVHKTLSSYLTNHTTTALADTIVDDSSGSTIHAQLNVGTHIGAELINMISRTNSTTTGSRSADDDSYSYLRALMERNDNNEVFGPNTLKYVVFIIRSKVTITNDATPETGIKASGLSALDVVNNKTDFLSESPGADDLTGEPTLGDTMSFTKTQGYWYAALCFDILT